MPSGGEVQAKERYVKSLEAERDALRERVRTLEEELRRVIQETEMQTLQLRKQFEAAVLVLAESAKMSTRPIIVQLANGSSEKEE